MSTKLRYLANPLNRDRFIQSYSADAGATWENDWIAVDERRLGAHRGTDRVGHRNAGDLGWNWPQELTRH